MAGVALVLCLGCLSSWGSPWARLPDGRLRHETHGYSLARPAGSWRTVEVEGTEISYEGPAGTRLSLLRECDRGETLPVIRARQLLIGLDSWELLGGHHG